MMDQYEDLLMMEKIEFELEKNFVLLEALESEYIRCEKFLDYQVPLYMSNEQFLNLLDPLGTLQEHEIIPSLESFKVMSMESIFEAIAGIVQKLGASIIAIIGAIIAAIALLFKWIFGGSSSSGSSSSRTTITRLNSNKMNKEFDEFINKQREDIRNMAEAVGKSFKARMKETMNEQFDYYKNVDTETLKNAAEEIDERAKNTKVNQMSPSMDGKVQRTKKKIKKLKKVSDDLVGTVKGLSDQLERLRYFIGKKISWKDMASFYFKNSDRTIEMHDKLLDNYEYKGLHKFFSRHIRGVNEIDSSKIVEDYCVDLIDRLLKNPGEISNFISSAIDTICKILDDREPSVNNKVNEYIFIMKSDKSKQKLYQDILKAFMKLSYVPFQLLVFGIMDSTNLLLMDLEMEIMSMIMKEMSDDEKKKIYDELMSDFNNYKESILKCGDVMKSSLSSVEDVKLLLDINSEVHIPELPRPMFIPSLSKELTSMVDAIKQSKAKSVKVSVEQAFDLIPFFYFLDNRLEKVNLSSVKLDISMGLTESLNNINIAKERLSKAFAGSILENFKKVVDELDTMVMHYYAIYDFFAQDDKIYLGDLLEICTATISKLHMMLNQKNYGKKVKIKANLTKFGKSNYTSQLDLTKAKFPVDPHIKKLTLTSLKLTNIIIRSYLRGSVVKLLVNLHDVLDIYVRAMNSFLNMYEEILFYIRNICKWLHFMITTITDTYVKGYNSKIT
jgi:hypothetical protein